MTESALPARPPARPVLAPGLVALTGALAAWVLGEPRPIAAGARAVTDPLVLLAIFDTVWLLVLCAPGRALPWDRGVVAVVGAPFHLVVAAAAGAGLQHGAALALVALAYAAASALLRPGRRTPLAVFLAALFGLPLAAYALGDLLGLSAARAWIGASPLTAPTLLARGTSEAALATAWPAVAAAALVVAVSLVDSRVAAQRGEA